MQGALRQTQGRMCITTTPTPTRCGGWRKGWWPHGARRGGRRGAGEPGGPPTVPGRWCTASHYLLLGGPVFCIPVCAVRSPQDGHRVGSPPPACGAVCALPPPLHAYIGGTNAHEHNSCRPPHLQARPLRHSHAAPRHSPAASLTMCMTPPPFLPHAPPVPPWTYLFSG